MEKILITGGAGYIGSHVAKLLNHNKKEIIVFDNLSIGKKKYVKHGIFFKGDLRNKSHLHKIFSKYKINPYIDVVVKGFPPTNKGCILKIRLNFSFLI